MFKRRSPDSHVHPNILQHHPEFCSPFRLWGLNGGRNDAPPHGWSTLAPFPRSALTQRGDLWEHLLCSNLCSLWTSSQPNVPLLTFKSYATKVWSRPVAAAGSANSQDPTQTLGVRICTVDLLLLPNLCMLSLKCTVFRDLSGLCTELH